MKDISNKVILITGASSGIGEATARELAKGGHTLILCARRLDRLNALAKEIEKNGGRAKAYQLDVTSYENFQTVVNAVIEEFGQIDVLVNNAGLMPLAPLSAVKVEEWESMIDVNIKGVLYGIASVQSHMEERGQGHIINTASIAAHSVFPTAAVYCGTKYAVWAISEGLRQEMNKIRVTTISPGVVESELAKTTTHESTREWLENFRTTALKPDAIARAIAFAINQPDDVDVNEIVVRPTASAH
ncbi:MAG: SDR family oxidoreductase [Pseudobdellovibrionaceae bacterium]